MRASVWWLISCLSSNRASPFNFREMCVYGSDDHSTVDLRGTYKWQVDQSASNTEIRLSFAGE